MTQKALTCAVLTVGRSDFSILTPLIAAMNAAADFDVGLWIGGAHFDDAAGRTAGAVEATGWPVWGTIETADFTMSEDSTTALMARHVEGVAQLLANGPRPDLVVILGDRYEAVSVALGLVPYNIPVAHISGGSITEGAIDDVFRHCITKISTLHFCDIPDFARRIHRMGEPGEFVYVSGALGLDGVMLKETQSFPDLSRQFDFPSHFEAGFALATLHPETRSLEDTERLVDALLETLRASELNTVFTYPNADPGADIIIERLEREVAENPNVTIVKNFGATWFYSAMAHAGLMIGNSSSGIIEAASFQLPVIDIGDRQKGRFHADNVIHCLPTQTGISEALATANSAQMRAYTDAMVNPYGDGRATDRILTALRAFAKNRTDGTKSFADYDANLDWELAPTS